MSSSDFREPTNDELWSQPPTANTPPPATGGVAPVHHGAHLAPAHHGGIPHQPALPQRRSDRTVFALAIVSLALGVPLTAISTSTVGLPGLLVVWIGIVLVNLVYARSRRKTD